MAKIGYARVRSIDQNLDRQLELLSDCGKIYTDKLCGKDTNPRSTSRNLNCNRERHIVENNQLETNWS